VLTPSACRLVPLLPSFTFVRALRGTHLPTILLYTHHVHYTVYEHVCTCCQSVSAYLRSCATCAAKDTYIADLWPHSLRDMR
jgi:hypothetical protein